MPCFLVFPNLKSTNSLIFCSLNENKWFSFIYSIISSLNLCTQTKCWCFSYFFRVKLCHCDFHPQHMKMAHKESITWVKNKPSFLQLCLIREVFNRWNSGSVKANKTSLWINRAVTLIGPILRSRGLMATALMNAFMSPLMTFKMFYSKKSQNVKGKQGVYAGWETEIKERDKRGEKTTQMWRRKSKLVGKEAEGWR